MAAVAKLPPFFHVYTKQNEQIKKNGNHFCRTATKKQVGQHRAPYLLFFDTASSFNCENYNRPAGGKLNKIINKIIIKNILFNFYTNFV